jgi:uncharacterized protein YbaP (TraB family)
MKKHISLILLLLAVISNAQTEKSLLWKISGNGLEKDSYLFGTMHVSEKIAFHLDDVFYESLMKSDFVALESDPNSWLGYLFESREVYSSINSNNANSYNFYNTSFEMKAPKQDGIVYFLSNENMLINGLLYRTNGVMQEYQEETYLDMFIYQGGSKFGKKIFSLEDIERSSRRVKKATKDPMKDTPDLWLQKKIKDDNYFSLITNSYRDRNIALIDSLNFGMYKDHYLENMLYKRNEEMANNIDSIIKTGSLFSAIGAAHLAGENGVINKLKLKGYLVTALTSDQTLKGQEIKDKIEHRVLKTDYISQTSSDGFFTAKVPSKLYELNHVSSVVYLCPDLKNGAFVTISRISTMAFLKGKIRKLEDIDKFLFEKIPGKILSKKTIVKQGIEGVDIINKTKTGDYQRYHIFFTPLEILIFKMAGKSDYTNRFGDEFFESIHFNNVSEGFEVLAPKHNRFEVEVPKFYSFINNGDIGTRLIQAVDKSKNNYYFVKEVVLNDTHYLEEDTFELERIHERFYKNLDLDYSKGKFTKNKNHVAFVSKTIFNTKTHRYLHLKTVIGGGHYYLLGFMSDSEDLPTKFFKSFKIKNITYDSEDFEVKKDTSLYFSVITNVKPKGNNYYGYRSKKKRKSYKPYTKTSIYQSLANEEINVQLKKYHDYVSYQNIDSLWKKTMRKDKGSSLAYYYSSILKKSTKNRKFEDQFYISDKKQGKDKNGYDYLTYLLRDTLTSRAVKVKKVYANGGLYLLRTLIDTSYNTSKFIDKFYDSFIPNDTIIGKDLFKNKTADFFKALKNKDSIVLEGYEYVAFEKRDINRLMEVISNFKFEDNQVKIKEYLIDQLGKFKTKEVTLFLERLYKNSFENPYNQISIFNSFANEKTKVSYKNLLKLLEYDIPLTSGGNEITYMMMRLSDSLEISKHLFPDLINYTSIREYKVPIYNLLTDIIDAKLINGKVYKNFKKQILAEARIELKRQLSKKIDDKASGSRSYYRKSRYLNDDLLTTYTKLLFPFRKDKNVANFLTKLQLTNNYLVKSTYAALRIKANEYVSNNLLNKLASNIESSSILYKKLNEIERVDKFPKIYLDKEYLYKSVMMKESYGLDKEKDSIIFVERRTFEIGKDNYEAFYYKSRKKDISEAYDKKWKLNYIVYRINDKKIILEKPFKVDINNNIDETKPLKDIIDVNIEKMVLKRRKRVNLSDRNNYLGLF